MKQTIFTNHSVALLLITFLSLNSSFQGNAAIKNGYEKDLYASKESLNHFRALLANNTLSPRERRLIRSNIASLVNHISYYEATENLLNQFRRIAPDLYDEVTAITDSKGRTIDVDVKVVPKDGTAVKAWGTTYIGQVKEDGQGNRSEHSNLTVSIKIWAVNQALLVLAHELGHVKYLIPNLVSYVEYYEKNYKPQINLGDNIGHRPDDPSGQGASLFVKRYRELLSNYLKTTDGKMITPLAIINDVRRDLKTNKLTNRNQEAFARGKLTRHP